MGKILIVDDDIAICRMLQLHFGHQGHEAQTANRVADAMAILQQHRFDVLILDIRMEGESGLDALPQFKALLPDMRVIMITAFHDMASTIEAMQRGADEYIHKPIDLDEIDSAVEKALHYIKLQEQHGIEVPANSQPETEAMVGSCNAMREIYKTIGRIANTQAAVLITGESGTGKEMVAQAVHRASAHRDGPFIAVNCAALVDDLLESEMFGHRRGAFSGAVKDHLGKFELANNGTIFLDEVGEMSPVIQAKLLRVLQTHTFTALGSESVSETNARVLAATNVDLEEAIQQGRFREDLYYRLQIVNIHMPPLRERKSDLVELVQALMNRINHELGCSVTKLSMETMAALNSYHWPGNIRELQNTLTKAIAMSNGDTLTPELIPLHIREALPTHYSVEPETPPDQFNSLEEVEKQHVEKILHSTGWHKGRACEILGVTRPRLQRIINKYDLQQTDALDGAL